MKKMRLKINTTIVLVIFFICISHAQSQQKEDLQKTII